jgi:hypothetical protein
MPRKFKEFVVRDKPKKRKGIHTKRVNKKKSKQKKKYRGQGR